MKKGFLAFIMLFFFRVIISQELLPDPYLIFLSPVNNKQFDYYSIGEFDVNSKYWKAYKNSPDIKTQKVTVFDSIYKEYVNYTDICIGLINIDFDSVNNSLYAECIATELNQSVKPSTGYHLEVQVMLNNPNKNGIYLQAQFLNTKNNNKTEIIKLKPKIALDDKKSINYFADFIFEAGKDEYDKLIIGYIDDHAPDNLHKSIKNYILLKSVKLYNKKNLPLKNKLRKLTNPHLSLFFQNDKTVLTKEEKKKLIQKINSLNIFEIDTIKISGHASDKGDYQYNMELSITRANTIKEFIKKKWKTQHIKFITKGFSYTYSKKYNWKDKGRRAEVIFHIRNNDILPHYVIFENCTSPEQLSYIGKIKEACILNNDPKSLNIKEKYLKTISKKYIDARKYIFTRSKNIDVLMINEAHHKPFHRYFAMQLLDTLYKNGFRYLAVEALKDTSVNSLNYRDPVYKKFLDKAKKLGYTLIAYDNNFNEKWQPAKENIDTTIFRYNNVSYKTYKGISHDLSNGMNDRDYNEYLNLKKHFNKINQKNKLLVYCGYGHVQIDRDAFWYPLGYYLKRDFGKRFLSIDQVTLNDCSDRNKNNLIKHIKPRKSAILRDNKGLFVKRKFDPVTLSYKKTYQVQILHPYDCFIPRDNCKTFIKVDLKPVYRFPVLVMIYDYDTDPFTGVAYAIKQINNLKENENICIPENKKYQILIKDRNNKVVYYGIKNR